MPANAPQRRARDPPRRPSRAPLQVGRAWPPAGADRLTPHAPDVAERQREQAEADRWTLPMMVHENWNSGASVSMSIVAPRTEGQKTSHSEHHGRRERLRDQEAEAEHHECEAGVVHRQHVQGVEAEDQADRADHPRRDSPGVLNSKIEAEQSHDHQDKCDIRVGDHREQPDEPTGLTRLDREANGGETPATDRPSGPRVRRRG